MGNSLALIKYRGMLRRNSPLTGRLAWGPGDQSPIKYDENGTRGRLHGGDFMIRRTTLLCMNGWFRHWHAASGAGRK